VMTSDKPN